MSKFKFLSLHASKISFDFFIIFSFFFLGLVYVIKNVEFGFLGGSVG